MQALDTRTDRSGWILAVGGVELMQIACDAVLDLLHASRHLGPGEVPVPVVDRLEL